MGTDSAGKTIILSYRRDDSTDVTGRIFDRLQQHFGPNRVFIDIDSIPAGVDFHDHLFNTLQNCGALLAIMGPRWSGPRGRQQGSRIMDEDDWVRLEVETALGRKIPVIPILVGNAEMPPRADLPEGLHPLRRRNAIPVDSGRDFHPHMSRLIADLEKLLAQADAQPAPAPAEPPVAAAAAPPPPPPPPPPPVAGPRQTGPAQTTAKPAPAPAPAPARPQPTARATAPAGAAKPMPLAANLTDEERQAKAERSRKTMRTTAWVVVGSLGGVVILAIAAMGLWADSGSTIARDWQGQYSGQAGSSYATLTVSPADANGYQTARLQFGDGTNDGSECVGLIDVGGYADPANTEALTLYEGDAGSGGCTLTLTGSGDYYSVQVYGGQCQVWYDGGCTSGLALTLTSATGLSYAPVDTGVAEQVDDAMAAMDTVDQANAANEAAGNPVEDYEEDYDAAYDEIEAAADAAYEAADAAAAD